MLLYDAHSVFLISGTYHYSESAASQVRILLAYGHGRHIRTRREPEPPGAINFRPPGPPLCAVEATVPGGRITEAVRESVRGEVIYDIEVDVRGETFDLEISPDGTVLDVEESN